MACYDVAGVAVRQDRSFGPGRWGLTLTEAATACLVGLVRDVGAGGQYAVVVDIEVAAQRFDGAPPGRASTPRLDERRPAALSGV